MISRVPQEPLRGMVATASPHCKPEGALTQSSRWSSKDGQRKLPEEWLLWVGLCELEWTWTPHSMRHKISWRTDHTVLLRPKRWYRIYCRRLLVVLSARWNAPRFDVIVDEKDVSCLKLKVKLIYVVCLLVIDIDPLRQTRRKRMHSRAGR